MSLRIGAYFFREWFYNIKSVERVTLSAVGVGGKRSTITLPKRIFFLVKKLFVRL